MFGQFRRSAATAFAAAMALLYPGLAAQAQESAAQFYAGRKLTLVVDSAPGGGYDTYGRVFARFFPNHMPGAPTIVVQNMPGAGGLVATNWLAEVAPRDGSHIEIMSRSIPLAPLMGTAGARFDPLKLSWIGSLNRESIIIFALVGNGITRFEQLRERPLNAGVTGATADSALWTRLLNNLAGTKLNIISGYPGSDAVNLAVERGENDVSTASWSSIKARKPDWVRDKRMNILAQFSFTPHPDLKSVPLLLDFVKDEAARGVFEFFLAPQAMGRPLAAPPGVPADRLDVLRAAFQATARDPAFLKAAAQAGLEIDPMDGDELLGILKKVYSMPPEVIARARAAAEQK